MKKFIFLFCAVFSVSSAAFAEEILVAVAANFKAPAEAIASLYEKETGNKVLVSAGSTGALYSQVKNGAPAQIFLSADAETPRKLAAESLALGDTQFSYAIGQLVLWTAKEGEEVEGGKLLAGDSFRRLAVANPKTAPYGAAAVEVLQSLGLWEKVQPKIVQGESIAQAYQFVATGNAEVGFVALSQVCRDGKIASGAGWIVPPSMYAPIRQDAILLTRGKESRVAKEFLEFLKGEQAAKIISAYGYQK